MHASGRAAGRGGGGGGASRGRGSAANRIVSFGRTSAKSDVPTNTPQPRRQAHGRLSEQRFDKHKASNPFASRLPHLDEAFPGRAFAANSFITLTQ